MTSFVNSKLSDSLEKFDVTPHRSEEPSQSHNRLDELFAITNDLQNPKFTNHIASVSRSIEDRQQVTRCVEKIVREKFNHCDFTTNDITWIIQSISKIDSTVRDSFADLVEKILGPHWHGNIIASKIHGFSEFDPSDQKSRIEEETLQMCGTL